VLELECRLFPLNDAAVHGQIRTFESEGPVWGDFRLVVTNRELCKQARCYSDYAGSIRPAADDCKSLGDQFWKVHRIIMMAATGSNLKQF